MSARVRGRRERWSLGRRLLAASVSVGLIAGIAAAMHLGCSAATAAGQRTVRNVDWFGTDGQLGLVMEAQAPGGPVTSSLWTLDVASGRARRIATPEGWYDDTFYGLSGGSSEGILAWEFRDAPEGMRSPGVSVALLPGSIAVFEQGKPVERLPISGSNVCPAVSPDCGQIAFVHMPRIPPPSGEEDGVEEEMAYGIWVWERESQNMRPVSHPGLGHSDGPPQWSPDGRTIAAVVAPSPARAAHHGRVLGEQWRPQAENDGRLQQEVRCEFVGRPVTFVLARLSESTGVELGILPQDVKALGERKLTLITSGVSLKALMVWIPTALQECHWDASVGAGKLSYRLHRTAGTATFLRASVLTARSAVRDARRVARRARLADAYGALQLGPEQLTRLGEADLMLALSMRDGTARSAIEAFFALPPEVLQQWVDTGVATVPYREAPRQVQESVRTRLAATAEESERRLRTAPRESEEGRASADEVGRWLAETQIALNTISDCVITYQDFGMTKGAGMAFIVDRAHSGGIVVPAKFPRSVLTHYAELLRSTGAVSSTGEAMDEVRAWSARQELGSPSASPAIPDDPRLRKLLAIEIDQTPALSEFQATVAASTGLTVISDYFTGSQVNLDIETPGRWEGPVWELLEAARGTLGLQWELHGDCLVFHHNMWYERIEREIPEPMLTALRADLKQGSRLALDCVADFAASISDVYGLPFGPAFPHDILQASGGSLHSRSVWALMLYAALSPEQRSLASSASGISLAELRASQRNRVITILRRREVTVAPGDISSMVFRVKQSPRGSGVSYTISLGPLPPHGAREEVSFALRPIACVDRP